MNIRLQGLNGLFFSNNGLKSTQDKLERQKNRDDQVAYLENRKNSLKEMECKTLEEISKKLELFHSYDEQIAAVKAEYNNSQMFHVLDEARERGEKIAEAAEKSAPKTAEERKEEMVEEALGIDDVKGELAETLEELTEMTEELTEEMTEELSEEAVEKMSEELPEEIAGETAEELTGTLSEELAEAAAEGAKPPVRYERIDIWI